MQQLLSRLNKLSLATGVTPDDLLLKMIETVEKSVFSTSGTISSADMKPPTRKVRRKAGWSPSARKHHSQVMKEIWAKKKAGKRKGGVKQLTPEHKAKLQAGYRRFRVQSKLAQVNA